MPNLSSSPLQSIPFLLNIWGGPRHSWAEEKEGGGGGGRWTTLIPISRTESAPRPPPQPCGAYRLGALPGLCPRAQKDRPPQPGRGSEPALRGAAGSSPAPDGSTAWAVRSGEWQPPGRPQSWARTGGAACGRAAAASAPSSALSRPFPFPAGAGLGLYLKSSQTRSRNEPCREKPGDPGRVLLPPGPVADGSRKGETAS